MLGAAHMPRILHNGNHREVLAPLAACIIENRWALTVAGCAVTSVLT